MITWERLRDSFPVQVPSIKIARALQAWVYISTHSHIHSLNRHPLQPATTTSLSTMDGIDTFLGDAISFKELEKLFSGYDDDMPNTMNLCLCGSEDFCPVHLEGGIADFLKPDFWQGDMHTGIEVMGEEDVEHHDIVVDTAMADWEKEK